MMYTMYIYIEVIYHLFNLEESLVRCCVLACEILRDSPQRQQLIDSPLDKPELGETSSRIRIYFKDDLHGGFKYLLFSPVPGATIHFD